MAPRQWTDDDELHWIGVDVGGTFTDLVVYDAEARALRILNVNRRPTLTPVLAVKLHARAGQTAGRHSSLMPSRGAMPDPDDHD